MVLKAVFHSVSGFGLPGVLGFRFQVFVFVGFFFGGGLRFRNGFGVFGFQGSGVLRFRVSGFRGLGLGVSV